MYRIKQVLHYDLDDHPNLCIVVSSNEAKYYIILKPPEPWPDHWKSWSL